MAAEDRLLARILRGASDANIPFGRFCALLRSLGFHERIKGSHHIYSMRGIPEILNLQSKKGKAKVYQVRQVRSIILKYKLAGGKDD